MPVRIIAAHKTETGGSQMVIADKDGRLWLQTEEPVIIEKLQLTHPHLIPMAEEAFELWTLMRDEPPSCTGWVGDKPD